MAKQTEIIENLLAVKDKNGYETFKLLLQSMSDLDMGKFINELRYCVKLSDGNHADLKNTNCAIFDVIERAFWQGRKCVKHQDFEDWFTDDIKEEIKKHVL